jgi:cellulose synthase/poly-beta-1,6-N-acetylglucosamine synthase-like glycosyltransferase
MFGEDSEIANRIARYGYRIAYEPDAIVYSEVPMTLKGVMQQRARWGIAFYQSRGRNWRLARALWTPRSLFYQGEVLSHAARFAQNMAYPVMAALAITIGLGIQSVSPYGDLLDFPGLTHAALVLGLKITTISALYSSLQLILFGYKLNKIGILSAIVCYPCVLIVDILVTSMIRPIIMNALLEWSVKWNSNKNLTQSFRALRRVANRVDPLYPAGDDSSAGIHSPEDSHKTAATNN